MIFQPFKEQKWCPSLGAPNFGVNLECFAQLLRIRSKTPNFGVTKNSAADIIVVAALEQGDSVWQWCLICSVTTSRQHFDKILPQIHPMILIVRWHAKKNIMCRDRDVKSLQVTGRDVIVTLNPFKWTYVTIIGALKNHIKRAWSTWRPAETWN